MKSLIVATAMILAAAMTARAESPEHFQYGVNNVLPANSLSQLGQPDPTKYHCWFDDFDDYAAAQWIITTTEAGSGDATEAVANAVNGILVITNDNADNDLDFLQWSGTDSASTVETFEYIAGKKLWFKFRLKTSDATDTDLVFGLQITDTTPLAVTDGVFFQKNDDGTGVGFYVEKNSTSSSATGISTIDTSYHSYTGYYDGVSKVYYAVDDAVLGSLATTNLVDDEELTLSFGIQNGAAVAKVLSVDYALVCEER